MPEPAAPRNAPPARPPRRFEAVRLEWHHGFDSVAPEWDALADELAASPFLRPGWVQAWWAAFGRGRPEALAVRRDGRLVGLVPVARRAGDLTATVNWHTMDYGLLAADGEARAALAQALFSARARRVSLGFLAEGSDDLVACCGAAERLGQRLLVRALEPFHVIHVEGGWDAYRSQLSKSRRGDLGRCRRRLEDRGHLELDVQAGPSGLEQAMADVMALEAAGWKGAVRTAMASQPETVAFYRRIMRWTAERGWLRLYILRLDGRAVAFHLVLTDHGVAYHLKSGFDEALRKCSPGMVILAEILDRTFSGGITQWVVLGGAEPYKVVWPGETRRLLVLQAFAPTAGGRLEWTVFAYCRPAAKRLQAAAAHRREALSGNTA
jgi:CelD/BcsL family acetyltransferase involved in cellulose biosynthesis